MDLKKKNHFKKLLQEERQRLVDMSSHHRKNHLVLDPNDLPDETDMASSQINQTLTFRIRDRERILLKKIDRALAKMAEGTFGECEECSDEIEVKRLEARPVATLCIKCKEEQEHRENVEVN